jgi:acyl carrier protein
MEEKFMQTVAEVFELPIDQIHLDLTTADLPWDSLKHIQLIQSIEETFSIEIPFEMIPNLNCLRDFYNFVVQNTR